MTPDESQPVEPHGDGRVPYVPPQVVDYGGAADLTRTTGTNTGSTNDGGSFPTAYVS